MKLSARNQLPGTVVEVVEGAVNGIVKIEVAPGLVISTQRAASCATRSSPT